jgi:hypothetical protein
MICGEFWDIYCNAEWFHLYSLAVCCILRTPVQLPMRMMAKAIETYWQLIKCDKTYCVYVHLLVLLHRFKHDSLFTALTNAKMAKGHSKIRSRNKLVVSTREHELERWLFHFMEVWAKTACTSIKWKSHPPPSVAALKGRTNGTTSYDRMQPLLKEPTSSTSKPPPPYDNEIPHTHSRRLLTKHCTLTW